jgi:hypothetical protein
VFGSNDQSTGVLQWRWAVATLAVDPRKMRGADSQGRPHFLLAEPGRLRVSSSLALARVTARKEIQKMLCNTNWLYEALDRPSVIAIQGRAAVNLAAFGSAFGSLAAAVRGILQSE